MARTRGDTKTLDLLNDWEPPVVAESFEPRRVQGHTDRIRMARAYSEAMSDSGLDRDEIHVRMQDYMSQEFSRPTLDRAAAPSAEHEFTASKLIAFMMVTQDLRVANELLKGTGFVAIPEKYLGAIQEAMFRDKREKLDEEIRLARKSWKAGF